MLFAATDRKWIWNIHPTTARTTDLGAMQGVLAPFFMTFFDENLRVGADKGMSCKDEPRCIAPYKVSNVASLQRGHTSAEKALIERNCVQFNYEWSRERVLVENVIGDLQRWAAARGYRISRYGKRHQKG
eukprot:Pompholyxophrys_punicea_v1_NODE_39_length_4727_cov_10.240848.p4 type:complete len:130 gc:universal NODE_39_length_4727_cov_10.240848:549-160(-)